MYLVYKATSPSGRIYIGVTNNFKRRMKEHMISPYPFGHAVRKYGRNNFTYEFELFDTIEEALEREAELVTIKEVQSKKFYNVSLGGVFSNVLMNDNPMHREGAVDRHPNTWKKDDPRNPMNNPDSKQRMIEAQSCKKVSIDGVEYYGVREAARKLDSYRQFVVHRLKSDNYPTWFYVTD